MEGSHRTLHSGTCLLLRSRHHRHQLDFQWDLPEVLLLDCDLLVSHIKFAAELADSSIWGLSARRCGCVPDWDRYLAGGDSDRSDPSFHSIDDKQGLIKAINC